jgi:hypothetical protein
LYQLSLFVPANPKKGAVLEFFGSFSGAKFEFNIHDLLKSMATIVHGHVHGLSVDVLL